MATQGLHSSHTVARQKLQNGYTETSQGLHRICTGATQRLHRSYTETAQGLHRDCMRTTQESQSSYSHVKKTKQYANVTSFFEIQAKKKFEISSSVT